MSDVQTAEKFAESGRFAFQSNNEREELATNPPAVLPTMRTNRPSNGARFVHVNRISLSFCLFIGHE